VYWTPNSESIGFLSSDPAGSIQLRLSPADASADAALVRQGSPMYWTWVDDATLFVHAGGGTTAFLGEVGPTGDPAGTSGRINGAGDFRAPAVSAGGEFRAYAGRGADRAPAVIVEPRVANGSPRTEAKVLGPAAVVFDPTGDRLAFIARANADSPQTDLPVGPLKVIDAQSSAVRTLLPGSVIGFFWSPDGRSIAALRVPSSGSPGTAAAAVFHQRANGTRTAPDAATQLSPNVMPVATAGVDLELLFVDPAGGTIRSQRPIRLAEVFTNQVLPYFDQYALSHRVWSSDGRSIALPVVGTDESSEIHVYSADGSTDTKVASGVVAFWRP
jgi:TolB protein